MGNRKERPARAGVVLGPLSAPPTREHAKSPEGTKRYVLLLVGKGWREKLVLPHGLRHHGEHINTCRDVIGVGLGVAKWP